LNTSAPRRILFISCNETPWGGSEELWARTAEVFAGQDHRVSIAKPHLMRGQALLERLRAMGCRMHDLSRLPLVPQKATGLLNRVSRNAYLFMQLLLLWAVLLRERPELAVLSQGGNWDGFLYGRILQRAKCPYVVIAQKATELYWPTDWMRPRCKALYDQALAAFFVSHHNHRLTEEQLGMRIDRSAVVRNPFLNEWSAPQPWPANSDVLRLACVGRFFPMEKAQDTLLRVLAQPKWRNRPVEVSFFGEGDRDQGLRELAAYLGVTCAHFPGFAKDITTIWADHHALILPTRAEGLPLVVVEAMLAGRVVIATDIGGSAEVCDDNITGFIAASSDVHAIDEALERAWNRRGEWPAIGDAAGRAIRKLVSPDPAGDLAAILQQVMDGGIEFADADGPSKAAAQLEAIVVQIGCEQRLAHEIGGLPGQGPKQVIVQQVRRNAGRRDQPVEKGDGQAKPVSKGRPHVDFPQ